MTAIPESKTTIEMALISTIGDLTGAMPDTWDFVPDAKVGGKTYR